MREIDTRLCARSCSCRMRGRCRIYCASYELHFGAGLNNNSICSAGSQVCYKLTEIRSKSRAPEPGPEPEPAKQTQTLIESHKFVISSIACEIWASAAVSNLQDVLLLSLTLPTWGSSCCPSLHVDVYICLLSLRALYCFIMSLGVFIVSMSLSTEVSPCCSSRRCCCCFPSST